MEILVIGCEQTREVRYLVSAASRLTIAGSMSTLIAVLAAKFHVGSFKMAFTMIAELVVAMV